MARIFVAAGSEARHRADPCKTGLIVEARRAAIIQTTRAGWDVLRITEKANGVAQRKQPLETSKVSKGCG
jgi:hypothetical protein